MRILVIGPAELHLGFTAAGADCVAAGTPQEALRSVIDSSSRSEVGVVLVAATVAAPIRAELDRIRASRPLPLILEIPDFQTVSETQEEAVTSLMARFGIKV